MKLGRLDYWLLDLVVEGKETLGRVASPEHELALNREGHGATTPELATAFARLYESGLIDSYRVHHPSCWQEDLIYLDQPTALDLLSRAHQPLDFDESCSYGLTELGGAAWEAAANPNWQRFVTESTCACDGCSPGVCRLEAGSHELALEYLNYLERDHFVATKTYEAIKLRPWQATYWKRLDVGVRFEFARAMHEEEAMRFIRNEDGTTSPTSDIDSEFFSAEPHWYTQPWR